MISSIVTRSLGGWQRKPGWLPASVTDYSFQTTSGAHKPLMTQTCLSPCIEQPGCTSDHSPISNAEVKNVCSCISIPPHADMASTGTTSSLAFTFPLHGSQQNPITNTTTWNTTGHKTCLMRPQHSATQAWIKKKKYNQNPKIINLVSQCHNFMYDLPAPKYKTWNEPQKHAQNKSILDYFDYHEISFKILEKTRILHKLGLSQDQNFDLSHKWAQELFLKKSVQFHTNWTNRKTWLILMCVIAALSN
jgi:hypothetical protein